MTARAACAVCEAAIPYPDRFCQPCKDSGASIRYINDNLPPKPEHAPGHPYGAQPGPNGLWARWCLRDDCDWRQTA